ncbi:MAG TPA: FAD-dependent monooxygenase [Pyrinomonadaceae bacterium]|nr:FAD-dependent monooxygenase [Pyrinomonadaceae bacterium]
MTRVIIVGGGIGGLTTALALRREGFKPEVFEQAPALLEVGAAIAVWPNAMRVLRRLGVGEAVRARGGLLEEARWLDRGGGLLKRFALPGGDVTGVALHRADLQGALLRALPPESVHLGKTFEGFDLESDAVRVRFAGGETEVCDVLVCADGLHSRGRAQLLGDGEPVYRGYTVWRGIARLEHPALAPRTASEIYGRGQRFGIGPVGMGRTGWWATANEPESAAELPSEHQKKLLRLFGAWRSPVAELIEATTTETILRNSTYDRPPAARWGVGRATLLGDAAHPMTPNFGQGGCMAIEDAAVLARCLAKYADASGALRAYESHRRARASRVVGYSLRYGAIGQWQSPSAVRLRGALLSTIPESLLRKLLGLIFDYDAYEVEV